MSGFTRCILGQFGKIYKGTLKRSGLTVAVKTIKRHESEREKIEFDKEMTIMSQLIHPNIVRLFGLVQQGKAITSVNACMHVSHSRYMQNISCYASFAFEQIHH